jgi:multidrug efflux pump subunit AcrA (membrane-fusion protein)
LEWLIGLQDLVMVIKCSFVFQTSVPVPSPGAGVIEERFVEDGATVKTGEKLFKLKLTGKFTLID